MQTIEIDPAADEDTFGWPPMISILRDTPMKTTNPKPVEFSCHAPKAKTVYVAGTFNDWKPDTAAMHLDPSSGKWTGSLPLPTGRHEYKFVVDGRWCCEPGCEHEYRGCPKCVANECGTMNRVLHVS